MGASERQFNGRERLVREVVQGVLAEPPASFSLVGAKLVGKSRLLSYLASDEGPLSGDDFATMRPVVWEDGARVIPVRIDCGAQGARDNLLAYLHGQISVALQKEAGLVLRAEAAETGSHGARLSALMRALGDMGYRLVLLLDNFDRVFTLLPADALNQLRPLTLQAALVVATEQPLHDLDRSLAASPLFNVMTQVFLGLVEPDAARRWVEEYVAIYPGIQAIAGELVDLTGTHPYLLRLLGDIMVEVRQMLPEGAELSAEHLPLIRLRLAEHARPLFETLWRRVQAPPARVQAAVVGALLRKMVRGPLNLAGLGRDENTAVNWLINQAMVICCSPGLQGRGIGYELFSPLLAEYLAERIDAQPVAAVQVSAGGAVYGAEMDETNHFSGGLTRTEAALLAYFRSHAGQVIPPQQLLRDVWKRPDATARRVQEAIRRLRLELEQADPPIGVIENDRGRGYRFEPARQVVIGTG